MEVSGSPLLPQLQSLSLYRAVGETSGGPNDVLVDDVVRVLVHNAPKLRRLYLGDRSSMSRSITRVWETRHLE
jgi:hypothetical protein